MDEKSVTQIIELKNGREPSSQIQAATIEKSKGLTSFNDIQNDCVWDLFIQ